MSKNKINSQKNVHNIIHDEDGEDGDGDDDDNNNAKITSTFVHV